MGVASDGGRNSGWRRHVLHRPPSRRSGVAYRLTVPCLMGNAGADLDLWNPEARPPGEPRDIRPLHFAHIAVSIHRFCWLSWRAVLGPSRVPSILNSVSCTQRVLHKHLLKNERVPLRQGRKQAQAVSLWGCVP